MRDAMVGRRRPAAVALAIVVAMGAGGCGPDLADPITPRAGSDVPGSAEPTVTPESASTPSPSDPVTGSFRRGGVPVPPDLLTTVVAACKALPTPAYAEEIGSRPVAVADLRGDSVVVAVFAGGDGATGCRAALGEDGPQASLFAVDAADVPLAEGAITLGAYELDEDGPGERTLAVGQYGDRVVKVRAGFDDDTYVTSSMDNGWYAMWWHGSVRPAVIVGADNRNEAMGKLTPPTGSGTP
jgi:hypothetical protein